MGADAETEAERDIEGTTTRLIAPISTVGRDWSNTTTPNPIEVRAR